MGADMPAMPAGATAPSFALWAVKDPTAGKFELGRRLYRQIARRFAFENAINIRA